jgi:diaminopimelate decarboxylase
MDASPPSQSRGYRPGRPAVTGPPWPLPALMSERLTNVLGQRHLLHDAVDACGSPLGIVVPVGLIDNVAAFRRIFARHAVDGRIWYACKVNKSAAFLEAAAHVGIGVDASSLWEVRAALGHGIAGSDIGVSGPSKGDRLLVLAMRHGCTISIDSVGELLTVARLAESTVRRRAHVLIRLSGFELTTCGRSESAAVPEVENSRFGVPLNQVNNLLAILEREPARSWVALGGFGFHIDNLVTRDRVTAIGRTLEVLHAARERGHPCHEVNIGGGIPVRYVRPEAWAAFHAGYAASLAAGQSPMYRGRSFDVQTVNGRAGNRGNFYFHDTPVHGAGFLDEVLASRPPGHQQRVASLLTANRLRLTIEPGRATIDQSGLTLCRIQGQRTSSRGDELVICEMNATNLWEQATGSEYAVDPVLLPRRSAMASNRPFVGHLVGNLCMENDVLAWRPVALPMRPRQGDLLAFVNTAGYQMDFAESSGHRSPLPRKVALHERDGRWIWTLDGEFTLADSAPATDVASVSGGEEGDP